MTTDATELRRRLDDLADTDPRLDGAPVRLVEHHPGPVVLLGVVHDHPASVARARRAVDALDPDVVALEAPDALAPAFTAGGDGGDGGDDAPGGELAAAAAAAARAPAGEGEGATEASSGAAVVGVDAPGRGTLRSVASVFADERPDVRTAAAVLADLGRLGVHAARGRLQTAGVPARWLGGDFERTRDDDCPRDASPREQAAHEAAELDRSTSLLRAFDPPPATRLLDAVRERQMGRRLAAVAGGGGLVVAVVGFSHLDGVEEEIADC